MDAKQLAEMIEKAADELHKAVEEQEAEIKKIGEVTAESEAKYVAINERLDALDAILQKRDLPSADPRETGGRTEEQQARKDAFYKYVRFGITALEPAERKALVEDTTGLYIVEPELDAEIVRTLPQITIMRGICAQRTIGSERIKMRSMSEVSVGWGKLETGTEPTESNMTPAAPTYHYIEDLYGLSKIGEDELQDTDVNLEPLLADSFARALGEAEEEAFVKGAGHSSEEPEGFTLDTTLVANTATTASAGAVIVEDFLDILYQCPTQYRRNGSFIMSSITELAVRKLREADGSGGNEGAFLWQPSVQAGKPNTFLGKPVYTQDDMEDLSGTEKCIAAFGDFKTGYRIIDRAGMSIQRLTELYAEAGLVGFKIRKRVGGGPMRAANEPIVLLTEKAA